MKKIYLTMWRQAIPYLRKGKKKDFIMHTKWVIKSMEMLLKKEKGDENLLMPAAILHDVGWSKIPLTLQKAIGGAKAKKAMELHLKYCPPIIEKILNKIGYDKTKIKKIIDIVLAHKFKSPRNINKRLLIDADTLSDAFKEPFYIDVKEYKITPKQLYNSRKGNKFYTKTAKMIFESEFTKRKREVQRF